MRDLIGSWLSLLCLCHCLALPLLVVFFDVAILHDEHHHGFHLLLIVPIALLAIFSLPSGYCRHHRLHPSLIGGTGIVLLVMGLINHEAELLLTVTGSLLMVAAHWRNRHLCRQQRSLFKPS
ncbi:MerC domain-containing protein [Idiomarina xiamenensis]|uniref:MerC mercury resistance protein n=1 Tax=Idiomarina xiamenensis 10-D-4 TaxID=740709 RepID=K2JWR5_9GAMM|nr:MerC domain-containing protein [Idiomarina xiamenensis]EKE79943.1 MerC mercury resistance protein [Idiomarina xiamenensis 10-D-4]